MTYGTIKVDTVTFTDTGVDKSVTLSGLVQNPTFSGNVTVTGTLSGVTVTGTTANFTSGNFTNISGGTHTITSGVFATGSAANPSITFTGDLNTGIYSPGADQVAISTGGSGRLFVDANGNVGVGTTTPGSVASSSASQLVIANTADASARGGLSIINGSNGFSSIYMGDTDATTRGYIEYSHGLDALTFGSAGGEAFRIDSSKRLLVGTSDGSGGVSKLVVQGASNGSAVGVAQISYNGLASAGLGAGTDIGYLRFTDQGSNSGVFAQITATADATSGANDYPGRLVFSTTADGASSPTERMRIDNAGSLIYGTSTSPGADITSGTGFYYQISTGLFYVRSNGSPVAAFNRGGDDGTLVEFKQDQTTEGTISVSGTTVSYNGAHLSRWSQFPFGQERTEILRGSVLSNIDEMCEWGEEDNEQLNRMKVSDVEGDKNVSGVFQAWDDDDDTYTNDFYCAMTGDFIIRIAGDVTVERGDLLMSAGDGTAKPQDDDIIRSKTIAKVTSTNVSCTYPDGSYCVPCVLMAC